MKSTLLLCASALLLASNSGATIVGNPPPPYELSITMGATTLSDSQVLPGFTMSFEFLKSLTSGQWFFNDPTAFANVTVPVLNGSGGTPGDKNVWTFDPATSFLTANGGSSVLSLDFDPPNFDVFFILDPDLTLVPADGQHPPVTVQDNLGGPGKDSSPSDTVNVDQAPEPASLLLVGSVMLLAGAKFKAWKR
jgi:hypothetical protein